jgi:c-di-GMP-binding flagellar brake protein YcgR
MSALQKIFQWNSNYDQVSSRDDRKLETTGNLAQAGFEPSDDREFFRIDVGIVLRYWPLVAGVRTGRTSQQIVNLSGGGIRFTVSDSLHAGEKIWIELLLPGAQPDAVTCIGRVVRLFDCENGSRQAALEFVNLTSREQDRIIAFCLAEQRKQLRRKVQVAHRVHS